MAKAEYKVIGTSPARMGGIDRVIGKGVYGIDLMLKDQLHGAILRSQYDAGADPSVMLVDLAAFSHVVTRLKLVPEAAKDPALTEAERRRGAVFAEKLSLRALSRLSD